MPEREKTTPQRSAEEPALVKESGFRSVFAKLRKRRIIETLAAFIGGGWLLVEVVERLLVGHYKFPEESIDLTVVSVIGAFLATLVWRWFGGTEKRPGNIKVEVLLGPLIILATLSIDLIILMEIIGISGKTFLIAAVAVCIGISWIIMKSLQWAAAAPVLLSGRVQKPVDSPSPASAPPEKSIVVLPFTDLSPQKDQEYFCDGMTEEIITDLSHVHDLLVISRNSAMTFRGTQKKTSDIAKEVNVRYVLEGSVRKAGNNLRITAQLIDAATDAHLWADKYSGTLDDIFDIQEKVSRRIVDVLKIKLTPEESQNIERKSIPDSKAYECYLKAQHEALALTQDGLERALTYLKNGLDIIGENALIYAGMGFVYWQYVNLGIKGIDQDEYIAKTEHYVGKSLELDPRCGQAHLLLGLINVLFRGKLQDSVHQFKQALQADPDALLARLMLVLVYWEAGKTSAALPLIEKCLETDPFNLICYLHQVGVRFFDGQFDLALESSLRAFKMAPDVPFISFWHAVVLAYNQRFDEAFLLVDQAAQAAHQDIQTELGLFMKYALKGEKEKIKLLLTPEFVSTAERDLQASYNLATFYAKLGDNENALNWLINAVNRGFINYPMLIQRDPWLANIRGEPRFKKLMERVKYEWEHFEV
jgi:non-specific serine/threonine protein kinase